MLVHSLTLRPATLCTRCTIQATTATRPPAQFAHFAFFPPSSSIMNSLLNLARMISSSEVRPPYEAAELQSLTVRTGAHSCPASLDRDGKKHFITPVNLPTGNLVLSAKRECCNCQPKSSKDILRSECLSTSNWINASYLVSKTQSSSH